LDDASILFIIATLPAGLPEGMPARARSGCLQGSIPAFSLPFRHEALGPDDTSVANEADTFLPAPNEWQGI